MPNFSAYRPTSRIRSSSRAPSQQGQQTGFDPLQVNILNAQRGMQQHANLHAQPQVPRASGTSRQPGVFEAGEKVHHIQRADGAYIPTAAATGDAYLVRPKGGSTLFSPKTGEEFGADPASPVGISSVTKARLAAEAAKQAAAAQKEATKAEAVQAKEATTQAKEATKQAEEANKLQAAEKTNEFLRAGRKYYKNRVTGMPEPVQSDDEFAKDKAAKMQELQQKAAAKPFKAKLDALQLELDNPDLPKVDEKDLKDAQEKADTAAASIKAARANNDYESQLTDDEIQQALADPARRAAAADYIQTKKELEMMPKAIERRKAIEREAYQLKKRIQDPDGFKTDLTKDVKAAPSEALRKNADEIEAQAKQRQQEHAENKASLDKQDADLAAQHEQAQKQYEVAKQSGDARYLGMAGDALAEIEDKMQQHLDDSEDRRVSLSAEEQEINRDVEHLGIVAGEINKRRDASIEQQAGQLEKALPGAGEQYKAAIADGQKRAEALKAKFTDPEAPEAKAAKEAFEKDVTAKIDGIVGQAAARKDTIAQVYDGMRSAALLDQKANNAKLTKEAGGFRGALQRGMNALGKAVGNAEPLAAQSPTFTNKGWFEAGAKAMSESGGMISHEAVESTKKALGITEAEANQVLNDVRLTNYDVHAKAAKEALKQSLGVNDKQATTILEDQAKLDWRGAGTALASKDVLTGLLESVGRKGSAGTMYVESEPTRLLSDGKITVNPKLVQYPDLYAEAVKNSGGTPEAQAQAIKELPDARRVLGKQALDLFANYPASGFKEWSAKQPKQEGADDIDRALAYADHLREDSGPMGKLVNQVVTHLQTGIKGLGVQALGLYAMATGSESAATKAGEISKGIGQQTGMLDMSGANDSLLNRAAGMTADIAPSVLVSMGGGMAAKGATLAFAGTKVGTNILSKLATGVKAAKTAEDAAAAVGKIANTAGFYGSAAAGAGQTAGAQFADTYASLREQGYSHEDAVKASRMPALLSGAITAILTVGFGKTGVEGIFAEKATKEAVKSKFRSIMGGFIKGAVEEQPEEIIDELYSQVSTEMVSKPNANLMEVVGKFIDSLPELALAVGVMGGVSGGIQGKRDYKGGGQELPTDLDGETAGPTLPEDLAAADVAISAWMPKGPLPNSVQDAAKAAHGKEPTPEQSADTARSVAQALVNIASGQDPRAMSPEVRRMLGIKTNSKDGSIEPASKNVMPLVESVADSKGKHHPVITDAARDWLTKELPSAGNLVKLSYAERAEQIKNPPKPAKKTVAKQPKAAKMEPSEVAPSGVASVVPEAASPASLGNEGMMAGGAVEGDTGGQGVPSVSDTVIATGATNEGAESSTLSPVDTAAHTAATSPKNDLPRPTEAQQKAGNYPMGHLNVSGLNLSIENPDGSERKWTNAQGESGVNVMKGHYGYIKGADGADGDKLDALVKAGTPENWNGTAYVILQNDPKTGAFDEHKVYIGFDSAEEAKAAYLSNYQKGWKGFGSMEEIPMADLASGVKAGALKGGKGQQLPQPSASFDVPRGTTEEQPKGGKLIEQANNKADQVIKALTDKPKKHAQAAKTALIAQLRRYNGKIPLREAAITGHGAAQLAPDGTVEIDTAKLLEHAAKLKTPKAAEKYIVAMFRHEIIHLAAIRTMDAPKVLALWKKLPAKVQADTLRAYNVALENAGQEPVTMADFQNGHEFIRALVEADVVKMLSEQVIDTSLKQELLQFLADFLEALRNLAKTIKDPAVRADVEAARDTVKASYLALEAAIDAELAAKSIGDGAENQVATPETNATPESTSGKPAGGSSPAVAPQESIKSANESSLKNESENPDVQDLAILPPWFTDDAQSGLMDAGQQIMGGNIAGSLRKRPSFAGSQVTGAADIAQERVDRAAQVITDTVNADMRKAKWFQDYTPEDQAKRLHQVASHKGWARNWLAAIDAKDAATLLGYNNSQNQGSWKVFQQETGIKISPNTDKARMAAIVQWVGQDAVDAAEQAKAEFYAKKQAEQDAANKVNSFEALKRTAAAVRMQGSGSNGAEWVEAQLKDGWRVVNISKNKIPQYRLAKGTTFYRTKRGDRGWKALLDYGRALQAGMDEQADKTAAAEPSMPEASDEEIARLFGQESAPEAPKAQDSAENEAWRRSQLEKGIAKQQAVSAAAVESYGIKLPDGYVKQGDRYVFQAPEPAKDAIDDALGAAFEGLSSPPQPGPVEQIAFPKDRREVMMKAASTVIDLGLKTPQELAKRLDGLRPDGALRKYARAFWRVMTGFDESLEESPDWNAVFAGIDKATTDATLSQDETGTPSDSQDQAGIQPDGLADTTEQGGQSGSAGRGSKRPGKRSADDSRPADQSGSGGDVGVSDVRPDSEGVSGGGEPTGGEKPSDAGSTASDAGTGTDVAGGERTPQHSPGRDNYHLTDPESIVGGGPKARFQKNKRALEVLELLEAEQRDPTPEELDALAAYTGWGALAQELFQGTFENPQGPPAFREEAMWLRDRLGKADWTSAADSVINAHYTDPPTVSVMWGMLRRLGFKGGRVLEPSEGIGNFWSLMPRDMMDRSQLTGIEMDTTTAAIAKLLHPKANHRTMPYQHSTTSDNFYDVTVGNWPFSNKDKPADRRWQHLDAFVHDFFFVKALAQTRPGGIVMGITSAGFFDKKNTRIRKYLAARAELVAAYRLPSGAFGKYAGTKVVTDIIILKKRETELTEDAGGQGWVNAQKHPDYDFFINEYFLANPGNVLGKIEFGHGTTSGKPGMIVNRLPSYEQELPRLAERVPEGVMTDAAQDEMRDRIVNNTTKESRQNTVVEQNGDLYAVDGESLVPLDSRSKWKLKAASGTAKRLTEARAVIAIRDAYTALMTAYQRQQGADEARIKLKAAYEAFTAKHGNLADSYMLGRFDKAGDPYAVDLMALVENVDGKERPRSIMERDIMRVTKMDATGSINDAYALHRAESAEFDAAEIARLAGDGTTTDDVLRFLSENGTIYKTPAGVWQPGEIYLAGNVRRKLREAEAAKAEGVEGMERNIDALLAIVPADVPYYAITTQMGAAWIPLSDYRDFLRTALNGRDEDIHVTKQLGGYNIRIDGRTKDGTEAQNTYNVVDDAGNVHLSPSRIFQAAMNGTAIEVKVETRDAQNNKIFVVSETLTKRAMSLRDRIRNEFARWVWQDEARAARLSFEYNEAMNSIVNPKHDGSHLRLPGLALSIGRGEGFDLRKHQLDAIWRGIIEQKGVYAHEVGTGKTFTMAGIAIEGKRMGRHRKPLLFAHNANSAAVAADFRRAYPGARILYIDSLAPAERALRLRQIASDDWDAIIVPHSLIDRFGLKAETLYSLAQGEIDALENEFWEAAEEIGIARGSLDLNDSKLINGTINNIRGADSNMKRTAKELAGARRRIISRIEAQIAQFSKPGAVFFEDMGIDAIMVDEAHVFKKIALATRKQVKGLNKTESGKGFQLGLLTDYLKRQTGGKGVHLFTGTPVTNTLNEVFNMMRFAMHEEMSEQSIENFDDWYNSYATGVTDIEPTSGGTWEAVERLRAFLNIPELARLAGQVFDVVRAKDMPEFKPRPSNEGFIPEGKEPNGRPRKDVRPIVLEPPPIQKRVMTWIRQRFAYYRGLDNKGRGAMKALGGDAPNLMDGDGKNAALDPRLVNPTAEDDPNSKVNTAIKSLMEHYDEHEKTTQMVFLERGANDLTTADVTVYGDDGPIYDNDGNKLTRKETRRQFNVVRDMVEKLVAKGVKPEEIAVFHNMNLAPLEDGREDVLKKVRRVSNSTPKEEIAALMNEGKIRIAFGGTETMGTGVNAQTWLRAMHHLDVPWMPGELEQRNGRGHRQGNRWNTVYEYRYTVEGTHDGKMWSTLLNKVRFIERFTEMLLGRGITRTLEGDGADASEAGDGASASEFEQMFSKAAGDPRILLRTKLEKDLEKIRNDKQIHYSFVDQSRRKLEQLERTSASMLAESVNLEKDITRFRAWSEKGFEIELRGKTYTKREDFDEAIKRLPKFSEKTKIGSFGDFTLSVAQTIVGEYFIIESPDNRGRDAHEFSTPSAASLEGKMRGLTRRFQSLREQVFVQKTDMAKMRERMAASFPREDELAKMERDYGILVREIVSSPTPAPGWLRHGAPSGSLIYVRNDAKALEPKDVLAHRWDDNGYWLLVDVNGVMTPVSYDEVLTEEGNRMFSANVEFKQPPLVEVNTDNTVSTNFPGVEEHLQEEFGFRLVVENGETVRAPRWNIPPPTVPTGHYDRPNRLDYSMLPESVAELQQLIADYYSDQGLGYSGNDGSDWRFLAPGETDGLNEAKDAWKMIAPGGWMIGEGNSAKEAFINAADHDQNGDTIRGAINLAAKRAKKNRPPLGMLFDVPKEKRGLFRRRAKLRSLLDEIYRRLDLNEAEDKYHFGTLDDRRKSLEKELEGTETLLMDMEADGKNVPLKSQPSIRDARRIPARGLQNNEQTPLASAFYENNNRRARAGQILRAFERDWAPFFVYMDDLAPKAKRKAALNKIIDKFALSDSAESRSLWEWYASLDPQEYELLFEDSERVKEAKELLPYLENLTLGANPQPRSQSITDTAFAERRAIAAEILAIDLPKTQHAGARKWAEQTRAQIANQASTGHLQPLGYAWRQLLPIYRADYQKDASLFQQAAIEISENVAKVFARHGNADRLSNQQRSTPSAETVLDAQTGESAIQSPEEEWNSHGRPQKTRFVATNDSRGLRRVAATREILEKGIENLGYPADEWTIEPESSTVSEPIASHTSTLAGAAAVAKGEQPASMPQSIRRGLLTLAEVNKDERIAMKGKGASVFFQTPAKPVTFGTLELRNAFQKAASGKSSAVQPIREVFNAAKERNPGLNAPAFMAQVKADYYNGLVGLEPPEQASTVEAAGPFKMRDSMGIESTSMSFLPTTEAEMIDAAERDERTPDDILQDWASTPLQSNPTASNKDAEYLAAVEAGDMEKAQRMVDAAAKAAGLGDITDENLFPKDKGDELGKVMDTLSSAFGDDVAENLPKDMPGISKRIGSVLTRLERKRQLVESGMPEMDAQATANNEDMIRLVLKHHSSLRSMTPRQLGEFAEKNRIYDYDFGIYRRALVKTGIIPVSRIDQVPYLAPPGGLSREQTAPPLREWLEKHPNEIAFFPSPRPPAIAYDSPLTRNVIPLSQRFNPQSDSILYANPTAESSPGGLSEVEVKELGPRFKNLLPHPDLARSALALLDVDNRHGNASEEIDSESDEADERMKIWSEIFAEEGFRGAHLDKSFGFYDANNKDHVQSALTQAAFRQLSEALNDLGLKNTGATAFGSWYITDLKTGYTISIRDHNKVSSQPGTTEFDESVHIDSASNFADVINGIEDALATFGQKRGTPESSRAEGGTLAANPQPAIDPVTEGDTPTTESNRANPGDSPLNRRAAAHARDKYEAEEMTQVDFDELRKKVAAELERDEQENLDDILYKLSDIEINGGGPSIEDQEKVRQLANRLGYRGRIEGDRTLREQADKLLLANASIGSELARGMGLRRDQFKTPQERLDDAIGNILAPSQEMIRKRTINVKTKKERDAIIAKIIEENDAKISKVLARNGLDQSDLSLSADDRHAMQVALMELPQVKRYLASLPSEQFRNAVTMSMRGYDDDAIARQTGLSPDAIERTTETFRNEIAKPAISQEIKVGKQTFGGFIDAGKNAIKWVLEKVSLKANPTPAQQATAAANAALQNQVLRILNATIPTKKQRNKRLLHPTQVQTAGGKPITIFVAYNPADWKQVYRMARELSMRDATAFDKGYEYWINGILSGPQTHVVNTASNLLSSAWHYGPQWFASATVNSLVRDPKSTQWGEFRQLWGGFMKGIAPAMKNFAEAWDTEADTTGHQYLNQPISAIFEGGHLDKIGNRGPSIGGNFGRVVRIPGRFLVAADAFAKTLIMHGEVAAHAYRLGKQQKLAGIALENFIASQVATMGSESWQDAYQAATELTFQDENEVTKNVEKFVNAGKQMKVAGVLFKFLFPFVRTPTNIYRSGIRKAGGSAGMLLYRLGKAGFFKMKDGTPIFDSYSKGKMVKDVSESVMAGLLWMALMAMSEGDEDEDKAVITVTGSRPYGVANAGERASQFRQEGGSNLIIIRLFGKVFRIPYGRYEPLALTVGTISDAAREFKEMQRMAPGDKGADKLAGTIMAHLAAQAQDKTFLQGIAGLSRLFEDISTNRLSPGEALAKQFVNGIIPNFFRQPLRLMPEMLADAKKPNPVLGSTTIGAALSDAEPKINEAGKPVTRTASGITSTLFPVATEPSAALFDSFLKTWNTKKPSEQWNPDPITKGDWFVYDPAKGSKEGKVPLTTSKAITRFETMVGTAFATNAANELIKLGYRPGGTVTPAMLAAVQEARKKAIMSTRKFSPSLFSK